MKLVREILTGIPTVILHCDTISESGRALSMPVRPSILSVKHYRFTDKEYNNIKKILEHLEIKMDFYDPKLFKIDKLRATNNELNLNAVMSMLELICGQQKEFILNKNNSKYKNYRKQLNGLCEILIEYINEFDGKRPLLKPEISHVYDEQSEFFYKKLDACFEKLDPIVLHDLKDILDKIGRHESRSKGRPTADSTNFVLSIADFFYKVYGIKPEIKETGPFYELVMELYEAAGMWAEDLSKKSRKPYVIKAITDALEE